LWTTSSASVLAMRAAARCKEGRTLLQTTFQPAVDSLLAERLVSSALAGPSTASSLVQLAQRTVSTQPGSSVGGLSRLYSTVARRNASLWNSAGVGPSQQVCYRSLLARAGAAGLNTCFKISAIGPECCTVMYHSPQACVSCIQANAALQRTIRRYFSSEPPRKGNCRTLAT